MVTLRDLFETVKAEPKAEPTNGRRIVIDTLILVVSVLSLLSGQATGWFRWVATGFSVIVIAWVASQLFPWLWATWVGYRGHVARTATVSKLHGEFQELFVRFNRYTDNTRSDSIPLLLIRLGMDEKVELPVPDTSIYHIWQLYRTLRERFSIVANTPTEFRFLAGDFGNLLELYHRVYVLPPYERLRSMDISKLSPYGQTRVRDELAVVREDYNDFIRVSNWFGTRVNAAFGGNVFPAHLEGLKPMTT